LDKFFVKVSEVALELALLIGFLDESVVGKAIQAVLVVWLWIG